MSSVKFQLLATVCLFAASICPAWADQSEPLALGPFELLPSGGGVFMVGAGEFNAFRQRDPGEVGASTSLNLEYRFGKKIFFLGFAAGGLANTDGGKFVYLGNYADIRFKKFIATPLLSVGAYRRGSGPDLGGTLQFRSSLTLAYELGDSSRFGVRIAHISNAGLHDDNPGANELIITYSFPF